MQECQVERAELDAKIITSKARQRYLEHLGRSSSQEDDEDEDDEKACILCRCDFKRGYITSCAHIFCEVSALLASYLLYLTVSRIA